MNENPKTMKENPITVTISLPLELFEELENLRHVIPRSSFYRALILRGKEMNKFCDSSSDTLTQILKNNGTGRVSNSQPVQEPNYEENSNEL